MIGDSWAVDSKKALLVFWIVLGFPLSVVSLFGIRRHDGVPVTSSRAAVASHRGEASVSRRVFRIRAGSDQEADIDGEAPESSGGPVLVFGSQDDGTVGDDGEPPPQRALILMDGFCHYHGRYLASRAQEVPGTAIIPVLSTYLHDFLLATRPEEASDHRRLRVPLSSPRELEAWRAQLPDRLEVVGVYCESDSGLADAEILRQALNVTCRDDPDQLEARRNKYLMQEWIREKTDLPVVRQKLCKTLQEAQAFASELWTQDGGGDEYVVVKPYRGVASESVHLCSNQGEIAQAFESIKGSAVFGSRDRHESVLVQEFLTGQEYAVDVVSRDGQHKIAAVWRYDKRSANGASFCYFQTRLVDASVDSAVEDICRYVTTTLTALGVRYGLSHNEIIMTSDRGPMLVEVNCRQHNMDFAPLTMACLGYNALDLTLVSFLGDKEDWDRFPDTPDLRAHGCMVHLVNSAQGRLKQVQHLDDMSALDSFLDGEVYEHFLTPGAEIEPTVDIRSDAGWVQLISEDEEDLMKDFDQIVKWMPSMFEVE